MTGTGILQASITPGIRPIYRARQGEFNEVNFSINTSRAIQNKIIRILHRIPNLMDDIDSIVSLVALVNNRLLKILGKDIAISPISVNKRHPQIRPELLSISGYIIQALAGNHPLDDNNEMVPLPLEIEGEPLLNLYIPKNKLSSDVDAQLILMSVQSVLNILVEKYVSGVREKRNLDLAEANLELAMMDPLLKIPCRRALDKLIQEYQKLDTLKTTFPVSVMMIDLDHFKKVNDTHGHDVGDRVLKHVADIISSECASHGSRADVFRMGGEELACVVHSCDSYTALQFAKKINLRIQDSPYLHENTEIRQTVSIGISTAVDPSHFSIIKYPDGSDGGVRVLKQADLALYDAKNIRNEVRVFSGDLFMQSHSNPLERRTGSRQRA